MSLLAVEFSIDQLEEFYRRCEKAKAETVEQKNDILLQMIKEKQVKRAVLTERSKEQYIQDASKKLGNVLYLKQKENQNDEPKK